MLSALAAFALLPAAFDNPPLGFSSTGEWGYAPGQGYAEGKAAIWASKPGATATWNPDIKSQSPVRISFYVVAGTNNEPHARFEIRHDGETETRFIDTSQGGSRWEKLGTFDFCGNGPEFVRAYKTTDRAVLRASAMRFEILDPSKRDFVWQTIVMDDLVPYDTATIAGDLPTFADMSAHWASEEASEVAAKGVLKARSSTSFAPNEPIRKGEFVAALSKLIGRPLNPRSPGDKLDPTEMLDLAIYAAKQSERNLEFAEPLDGPAMEVGKRMQLIEGADDPAVKGSEATRAQASAILARLDAAVIQTGQPEGKWRLTFNDEFSGSQVDTKKWAIYDNETYDRILSSRFKENLSQKNGRLALTTKKETKLGKGWTTAMLETRTFRQKYGYFEARLKLAPTSGLNQAFWLRPKIDIRSEDHFEIDVVEGHYPNVVNMSLHQKTLQSMSKSWRAPVDMSKGFHTYAIDWNPREIVFYFDGKEVDRKKNTKANLPAVVLLSTAVVFWAGPIKDSMAGKSMLVDWVRVYERR